MDKTNTNILPLQLQFHCYTAHFTTSSTLHRLSFLLLYCTVLYCYTYINVVFYKFTNSSEKKRKEKQQEQEQEHGENGRQKGWDGMVSVKLKKVMPIRMNE
jgi:hypothetical protein